MRRRWCGLIGELEMARRIGNHKEHKGHKETGARQVFRATGPTIAAAPRAAEDGGYQNGQRRETEK